MTRLALLLLAAALAAGCDVRPPKPKTAAAPAAQEPASRPELGRLLGVAVRAGVGGLMIVGIDLDGPLSAAGAQVGDFIVAVNGGTVASESELFSLLSASRGAPVGIDLWRNGEKKQVAVALARPERADAASGEESKLLGLQVRELAAPALASIGVDYGVMVTRVRSPADRSRIMPGDVIIAVNQQALKSLEQFHRLMAEAHGTVALLVRRAEADLYIALEPAPASSGASRLPEDAGRRRPTGMPLRT